MAERRRDKEKKTSPKLTECVQLIAALITIASWGPDVLNVLPL